MRLAQALHRQANGRRMVGKVIDHLDTIHGAPHFLTAGHTTEFLQSLADLFWSETGEICGGRCHGRISNIKLPGHGNEVRHSTQCEGTELRLVADILDPQVTIFTKTHGSHRTWCIRGNIQTVGIITIYKGDATARNDIEQALEGQLDLIQRMINIRVVELDIVHHHTLGQVVEEF